MIIQPIIQPKVFDQLLIFLLDYGESMNEYCPSKLSKRQYLEKEMREFLQKFSKTFDGRNNSYSIINFYNKPNIQIDISPISNINERVNLKVDFDTQKNLSEGLGIAKQLAVKHLYGQEDGGIPKSAVIFIVSDGYGIEVKDTFSLIYDIKSITHDCIYSLFIRSLDESQEDVDKKATILKSLCSEKYNFLSNFNAEELIEELNPERDIRIKL